MQENLEMTLEITNAVIAVFVILLGMRAVKKFNLALQKRAVILFLATIILFAFSEILTITHIFFESLDVELVKEILETLFVTLAAISLIMFLESDKKELSTLKHRADIDGLTALYNHAYLYRKAEESFKIARERDTPLSILLIDIDDFKAYNDQYGHEAGNDVLKNLAQVLRDEVRKDDLIARYGGEEFVVVISNDIEHAIGLANRIRTRIEETLSPKEQEWLQRQITVSIGTAMINVNQKSVSELIDMADSQMYLAKEAGKNRVSSTGAGG